MLCPKRPIADNFGHLWVDLGFNFHAWPGSVPIFQTLQKGPILGLAACQFSVKEIQYRAQAQDFAGILPDSIVTSCDSVGIDVSERLQVDQ